MLALDRACSAELVEQEAAGFLERGDLNPWGLSWVHGGSRPDLISHSSGVKNSGSPTPQDLLFKGQLYD